MTISTLPPAPSTNDPANFDVKADALIAALPQFVTEANSTAAAMNFNSTNGTSATSNSITVASKTFTADVGKSWQLGMTLKIANTATPTNSMTGDVTAYNSGTGSLTVNVTAISGSGTFSAWTISQSGVSSTVILNTNRNLILNSDMSIDQRNEGDLLTPTASSYTVDRWAALVQTASKLSFQRVVDAPAGFTYSTKIAVVTQTAPGVGDRYLFRQPILGYNAAKLNLGSSNASTITCTLWIKGTVAGTYSCSLTNDGNNRSYIGTITVTTSWALQTFTLTGDTSGSWLIEANVGLVFSIDLGSGTNSNATAGSWQAGPFTRTSGSVTLVNQVAASSINITGIQVEPGSVSTPIETIPRELLMEQCRAYYEKTFTDGIKPAQNAGQNTGEYSMAATLTGAVQFRLYSRFTTPKHIPANIVYYNTLAANAFPRDRTSSVNCSALTISEPGTCGALASFTQNASTSAGNLISVHWTAEAELAI
jgi:hypothetical protein